MKKKKRKNTRFYVPLIQKAIADDQVWVRQVETPLWYNDIVDEANVATKAKYYEIAFGTDFESSRSMGSGPWTPPSGEHGINFKVAITDYGNRIKYRFNTENWAPHHVKFTTDAEIWFEKQLEQIVVLYRLGAYQSKEEYKDAH